MRRREFIAGLGGVAAHARAQQPGKTYRIDFPAYDPTVPNQPAGHAFLDGLRV
jgi:hypothetical protein